MMSNDAVSPVDLSYLQEYTDGDEEMIEELIEVFYETVVEGLATLKDTIAEDPTDQWKAAAHKLKGAAGYVGAEQMKTLCAHAQNMEAANTEERTRTYEKIEQSYNAVRHFLEERSA